MLRAIFHYRIRAHSRRIFRFLFPQGYAGEIFLCGGAFKPLLRKGTPINDLDLWVRNRKDREKLCQALLARGATLLKDFHPYCLKFRLEGQIIEITYHNVNDGTLADVINTFDLAICGMGTRYVNGRVVETYVSPECWQTMHHREVTVLESYLCMLVLQKTPSLLRTLHRMGQHAAELDYRVHGHSEHRLWDLYWNQYTEEERRAAMDLYFDTMVSYKGQQNEHLVHRATAGYAPVVRQNADTTPVRLTPRAA